MNAATSHLYDGWSHLTGPDKHGYWSLAGEPVHCGEAFELMVVTASEWDEERGCSIPTAVTPLRVRAELSWADDFRHVSHKACVHNGRILVLHPNIAGAPSARMPACSSMWLRRAKRGER